ncbi:MAG TPA: SMR family transporter [Burkholderiales bacterium]|jgi:multidrug transporter EmrE-like cation transporter
MNAMTFSIVLSGVLLNAGAQLLLKAGTNVIGVIGPVSGGIAEVVPRVALQPFIVGGLACYVVSVALWIVALSRVDVSIAYPMLSIGYVVNAFAAWYLFGEALTPLRLTGIAVIVLGVFLISRS